MTWLISFETGEVLAKDGKSITSFSDDALRFDTQEDGLTYIDKNRETLQKLVFRV